MKRIIKYLLCLSIICSFIPNWGWIMTPRDIIMYDLSGIPCYLEDCCLRYEKRLWGNSEEKAYYGNEVFHNGLIQEIYWNKQYICAVIPNLKVEGCFSYYIAIVSKDLPYKVYGPLDYETYYKKMQKLEIDLSRMNHVNTHSDSFWNYTRFRGICCWAEILIILYCLIHLFWIKFRNR